MCVCALCVYVFCVCLCLRVFVCVCLCDHLFDVQPGDRTMLCARPAFPPYVSSTLWLAARWRDTQARRAASEAANAAAQEREAVLLQQLEHKGAEVENLAELQARLSVCPSVCLSVCLSVFFCVSLSVCVMSASLGV